MIDGGLLLHRLKWETNSTVEKIINSYLSYVAITGLRDDFDKQTQIMTSKDVFLSNSFNKQRFVDLLANDLTTVGHQVTQCEDDADLDIVQVSLEKLSLPNTVVVVADDTDIFILLLHYLKDADPDNRFVMYRPSLDTAIEVKDLVSNISAINIILENLLLAHAASGCNTVSALSLGLVRQSL